MIRDIMRSERLDELPAVPIDPERISFFSRLFKTESLPFDERPELRGERTSFIARLFSREALPVDPVPGPGPAGLPTKTRAAGRADNHQGKGPWQ